MTLQISTFCQKCDEDIEVDGTLLLPANTMSYTCTKCGYEQEQSSWIDEGNKQNLTLKQAKTMKVSVDGRDIL